MKDDKFFNEVYQYVLKQIDELANRIALLLERETVSVIDKQKGRLVATGDMRKGITSDVEKKANEILIKIFGSKEYTVFPHEGTKPHFPPIAPILSWVKTKKIAGIYSVKSRRRLGGKLRKEREDKSLAYAIAKKIAKKGTRGIKFFDLALKQAEPLILKEIEKLNLEGAK